MQARLHTPGEEPAVRIVVAQGNTVLGAAGEHPVGLFGSQGYQIIDENPDVGFGAIENHGRLLLEAPGGVDSGHEPLGGGLFVAAGAVGLAGDEQTAQALGFQGRSEIGGVEVVVLHRVAWAHDFSVLEAGDAADVLGLGVFGKTGGEAVEVHFLGFQSFGFHEDVMTLAIGKLHHFVFDGGAVAGSVSRDAPGEEGGAAQMAANDLVGAAGGVGDVAGQRRTRGCGLGKAEGNNFIVAELGFHALHVQAAPVHPRGGAGFHSSAPKAHLPQPFAQAEGRGFSDAPRGGFVVADENFTVHECAGGEHHRPGADAPSAFGDNAADFGIAPRGRIRRAGGTGGYGGHRDAPGDEIHHGVLKEFEVVGEFQGVFGPLAIGRFIGLGPGCLNGGSAAAVEHPELYHRGVDNAPHLAAEGIDFPHHVALGQTADRRIAGELTNRVQVLCYQDCGESQAGEGEGRLDAGVPGTNHRCIIVHTPIIPRRGPRGKPPFLSSIPEGAAPRHPPPQARRSGFAEPFSRYSPAQMPTSFLNTRAKVG